MIEINIFCDMGRQIWYFIVRVPTTCPTMAKSPNSKIAQSAHLQGLYVSYKIQS